MVRRKMAKNCDEHSSHVLFKENVVVENYLVLYRKAPNISPL
jgi:hypothetical protein